MGGIQEALETLKTDRSRADVAAALADGVRIVNLFMHLPTSELVTSLNDGSLASSVEAVVSVLETGGTTYPRVPMSMGRVAELDTMRQDFTRLFSHPKHPVVLPCESLFLTPQGEDLPLLVVNGTAENLDALYRRHGYTHAKGGMIPGDHISLELDFLCCELDRLANGEEGALEGIQDLYESHGSRWWGRFFDAVERAAQTSAYRFAGQWGNALLS